MEIFQIIFNKNKKLWENLKSILNKLLKKKERKSKKELQMIEISNIQIYHFSYFFSRRLYDEINHVF